MEKRSSETSLFRKTMFMVAVMLGACVVFVGALSIVVSSAIGKSSKSSSDGTATGDGPVLVPANRVHGSPMPAATPAGADPNANPRLAPRGPAQVKPNQVL